jgi:cytochrome c oxidase subunit 4
MSGSGQAHPAQAHTQHAHPTVKTFVFVWATLMVFTGLTVFAATVELGPFNAIVALTIATIKALLVLLFFMELRYSPALTKVAIVVVVFFLFLLAGLTLSDYLTRGWSSYINPFLH